MSWNSIIIIIIIIMNIIIILGNKIGWEKEEEKKVDSDGHVFVCNTITANLKVGPTAILRSRLNALLLHWLQEEVSVLSGASGSCLVRQPHFVPFSHLLS